MSVVDEIKLLLIEDNMDEAELIHSLLKSVRKFRYKITHAESLREGLGYLEECALAAGRYDVVLLDLNLSDSSGFSTFDRLYQRAAWAPVILMTNLGNEDLALEAVRKGAQDYLVKTEMEANLLSRTINYAIERKRVQEALRESEERYTLAVQGANDGLWDWDLVCGKVYYSPRWKQILGYHAHEINGQPSEWLGRIHPDDLSNVRIQLNAHIQGMSDHFECEYRIARKDGSYGWALTRGLAVRGEDGKAYRMAGSQTDITLRKRTEEQLLHDAFHDSLTELPNRALLLDRLGCLLDKTRRFPNYRFAVLLLDLDRFKVINESFGHLFGDQLLIAVAKLLAFSLREGDSLARLGGDEFVILLESVYDLSDAVAISERIMKTMRSPLEVQDQHVVVTASIGIVMGDFSYSKAEDVLRDADIAMYQAKVRGKDGYAVFTPQMHKRAIARMGLENDLRLALADPERLDQEFIILFQPIIRLDSGWIVGFEALVRWKHPKRGLILPNEFIPIAEETGLIHALGNWILRKSCQQLSEWQHWYQDSPETPPISINVNISGRQFSQPDLVDQIRNAIEDYHIAPSSLNLEITESWLMENKQLFWDKLDKIRKLGVNLQVDDFGRGYSSYSYLQNFPINSLKIDAAFIQRLEAKGNNAEIVRSIVRLASTLGLSVIAEGVENEIQYEKLRMLGCPLVQGFYISRPVESEQAGQMIRQSRRAKDTGGLMAGRI